MNDQALELYRKACGLKAPLVLECDGASRCALTSFFRTFDCPFVLIGRDPRSDFVLESPRSAGGTFSFMRSPADCW